jgi:hypothetical protein
MEEDYNIENVENTIDLSGALVKSSAELKVSGDTSTLCLQPRMSDTLYNAYMEINGTKTIIGILPEGQELILKVKANTGNYFNGNYFNNTITLKDREGNVFTIGTEKIEA